MARGCQLISQLILSEWATDSTHPIHTHRGLYTALTIRSFPSIDPMVAVITHHGKSQETRKNKRRSMKLKIPLMSVWTQSSRQVTIGRMRSLRRSGRADEEQWSYAAQQSVGSHCTSVWRFMSPPWLIQLIKSMCILKCDLEEQQDLDCVTKLLKWRFSSS